METQTFCYEHEGGRGQCIEIPDSVDLDTVIDGFGHFEIPLNSVSEGERGNLYLVGDAIFDETSLTYSFGESPTAHIINNESWDTLDQVRAENYERDIEFLKEYLNRETAPAYPRRVLNLISELLETYP